MASDAAAGASKLAEWRKSHPIDFSLLDKDDQAVLYISEDEGDWELHLTIANTSSQRITLADGAVQQAPNANQASSANHHFALRFRPGTLSQRTLALLNGRAGEVIRPAGSDWELAQTAPPAPNEPVTLYLRCKGADRVLAQDKPRTIRLSGFSAAPGSGSRGTQVELIPNQKQVKFEADANSAVAGSRTQYLHITNHSGRKNIPLYVGFVGGNQILNGAVCPQLTLRLTNVLRNKDVSKSTAITFRGQNSPTREPRSELVLSYDKGAEGWELGTGIEGVKAVSRVKAGGAEKTILEIKGVPDNQANRPGWVMAFEHDFSLEYGQSIDIEITKIVASPNAGHANLYLHYDNVPGYWDGQFVCTVEKGLLVARDGGVGIGTAQPEGRLNVVGSEGAERGVQMDNGEIKFRGDGAAHFSIFNGRVPQYLTIDNTGRDKVMGAQCVTKGAPSLLSIHVGGNVGIGVDNPSEKLEVAGATKLNFGPDGTLLFRGNVERNPGIFVHNADKLTICAEGGRDLPSIQLGASEVMVNEKLTAKEVKVNGKITAESVLITGEITLANDIWKHAVEWGPKWHGHVEHRIDARGVVHLKGTLHGNDRSEGAKLCRLNTAYLPKSLSDIKFQIMAMTTWYDPDDKGHALLMGKGPEFGWLKISNVHGSAMMILFDGIMFGPV